MVGASQFTSICKICDSNIPREVNNKKRRKITDLYDDVISFFIFFNYR